MRVAERELNVLAVDDAEANLELLSEIVAQPGVNVLTATSGEAALELAQKHEFALAILDIQMPGMDGFALAERLREAPKTRNIPLLFLTAGRERAWVFRGFELGAVDFLFKPVEPQLLRYKVSALLELYRQRLQIQESLRVNELFVAVLAHDLRSPLSAVVMGADLLSRSPDSTTSQIATKVRASGRRMGNLIDQLCDLSRARLAGGIPLTRREADLCAIVERSVQEFQMAHPTRTITIEKCGEHKGNWDEERLEQVVANLVGNAIRHGEASSPITVNVSTEGADVVFSVTNAGTIPTDQQSTLFEPFKSIGKPGARREGLGLGLYIVQQIVEAHGGSVTVTSVDGKTTFSVRLPTAAPKLPSA
jgi:two-component system sensor histidine kinase/response regulator